MTHHDLQYVLKKDVRNNPIHREVDRGRQREFAVMLGIGAALVVVTLLVATQQFAYAGYRAQIERMREELRVEADYQRRFQLELATLSSPQQIGQRSRRELDLVAPRPEDVIVLERLPTGVPPSGAVVARK